MYFLAKHAYRKQDNEKQKQWEQRTRTRNTKDDTRRSNKAQNRKTHIKLHQNIAEASWFPSKSWQVSKDDVPDAPPMYKMVMACSFQVRNKKRGNLFQFELSWPATDSLFPYPHKNFEKVAWTFFFLCRAVFPSIS